MGEEVAFSLGPIAGGLWFGVDQSPPRIFDGKIIEEWPCIQWKTVQVGGLFCRQYPLFGVEFAIRADDPLSQLGKAYQGTSLPGDAIGDYQTPAEAIEGLRNELELIGLLIDGDRAQLFAEAYIPLDAISAWQYVVSKNFRLQMPQGMPGSDFCTRGQLGLENFDLLRDYLKKAFQDVVGVDVPSPRCLAAAVFENSD